MVFFDRMIFLYFLYNAPKVVHTKDNIKQFQEMGYIIMEHKSIEQGIFILAGIIVIIHFIFLGWKENQSLFPVTMAIEQSQTLQQGIAEHIIRFHVLANSDSKEDQALKLKVKDRVVKAMQEKLKNVSSIEEARKVLQANTKNMETLANQVIKEEGYSYTSHAKLEKTTFPIKQYGDLTFPAGEYEAFRILIGNAEGKNWWCVMFPTLCYVDETYDVITKENKEQFKTILTKEEYESIDNESGKCFFKFRLFF